MSRVFNDLSEEERDALRAVAKNNNFLQSYRGYDDYYMAELWGNIALNTYDDYKIYGPGKAALKFINIARRENLSLDRFLLNDPEVPFFRKEPASIKPCDYALKMLGTTIALEPHMSRDEKHRVAVEYFKALSTWLKLDIEDNGNLF